MRQRLNRDLIVNAAFRAWGRTHFTQTSINLVAKELAVSKPALYRYFRSKEDILFAMGEDYAALLRELVIHPLRAQLQADPAPAARALVGSYLAAVLGYFSSYPYHYLFYVRSMLGRSDAGTPEARDALREHQALLMDIVQRIGTSARATMEMAARYLSISAAFWSTDHYRRSLGGVPGAELEFTPENLQLTQAERDTVLRTGIDHIMDGFVPRAEHPDWETVERIAWIRTDEVPQRDRITHAITETVQEVGYPAATVERIAERAGLSKAGLYHYFSNRDDMLAQTIMGMQNHVARIARTRLAQLADHTERLYSLFVMAASWAVHEPSMIIVENWLRESNIEVQIPPDHIVHMQRIYTFVTEMIMDGQISDSRQNGFAILTFINFFSMRELARLKLEATARPHLLASIRSMYRLFADGLVPVLANEASRTGVEQ